MAQFERKTHRAREHLLAARRMYPEAWKQAEQFRTDPDLPRWPEWCYMPLAGAYAIVSADAGVDQLPLHLVGDVSRVGALAGWRMTQGIYRFDPAVYPAVADTPLTGDLPSQVLHRLPEWCVYVETPDILWRDDTLYGAFAHLEYDVNHGREELRLLMDGEAGLDPVPVHLGDWPLDEAVARMLDTARTWATSAGITLPSGGREQLRASIEPVINLLLYLCTEAADLSRRGKPDTPTNPQPKRTRRHGWKLFPANGPTEWDSGVRLGAALRAAYQREETGQDPAATGRTVRPHVRRAHWHTVLSGRRKQDDGSEIPASERKRELRWMPPIPVAVEDMEDLPSTIRPVK